MNLADYVNSKSSNNMNSILEFIKTKDITTLKNYFGATLDIVFDPLLLNKTKTNFNDTILNTYKK